MKLALILGAIVTATATTALAEDWRPVAFNNDGYSSVDFDGVRGPSSRRLAWVLHSLRETDKKINYDYVMVRYVVDCDEETVSMTSANHYLIDGTLRYHDTFDGETRAIAPGTLNQRLADAICADERPDWEGYTSATAATLALRQMPQ